MNKKRGNRNRDKGHDAERFYAKIFKDELGFKHCVTSRYGSRLHDDAGIDLIHLPINVQIKAGRQKSMNPSKVLFDIKQRVNDLFPSGYPERDNISVLIHKKDVGQGRKREEQDELAIMTMADFIKLMKKVKWD